MMADGTTGATGAAGAANTTAPPEQPAAEQEPRGEISFLRVGFLTFLFVSEAFRLFNDTSTYQNLWQELLSCESIHCALSPMSVLTNMLNKDAFISFILLFALFEPITCVRRTMYILGCYLFPFAGQLLLFNKRSFSYMIACALVFMAATFAIKHFLTTLICSGAFSACLMLIRLTFLREGSRDHVSVRECLRRILSREAKSASSV